MDEYRIGELAQMLTRVLIFCRNLAVAEDLGQDKADHDYCEQIRASVDGLAACCSNFQVDRALLLQMRNLDTQLKNGTADTRSPVLHARIAMLIDGVQENLNSRKFMFMPADEAWYWNNADVFGNDFLFTFPRAAVFEGFEAGNCYAASRHTACVFHCMRVAEYGLRKLARKLKVKISDKGKNCPLEYGDWDKVITASRNAIAEARRLPRGPKKEEGLQFYSRAADHCEYMKDIWRNETSHTRRRYSKSEALAVINRVRDFISLLSEKDARREVNKRIKRKQRAESSHASGKLVSLRDLLSPRVGQGKPETK